MKKLCRHAAVLICFLVLCPRQGAAGLVFSTHPFSNPAAIHNRFAPLIAYLSRRCGEEIDLRVAANYISHVRAIGTGAADLGFAGPSPYVRARDKYGHITLLARFKLSDDINDKMVIITRRDSGIKTLADLRGKSFAFGDHQSFGSHFMPRWLLDKNGVPLHALKAYDFVKSHDNVVLSVLHRDFTAGGVRLDVFRKYASRPLRILAGPFAIPPHVIVCRSDLDPGLRRKLRAALLGLDDPELLRRIDPELVGFVPVDDRDFDQARRIMAFIESR